MHTERFRQLRKNAIDHILEQGPVIVGQKVASDGDFSNSLAFFKILR